MLCRWKKSSKGQKNPDEFNRVFSFEESGCNTGERLISFLEWNYLKTAFLFVLSHLWNSQCGTQPDKNKQAKHKQTNKQTNDSHGELKIVASNAVYG